MALSTDDIYGKAVGLSADVEDNFLELGRCLRQLQDRDLEMFQKVVNKTNLGRRKAYYLVEVSRAFDPLTVPRARLRKIGWTKLQLIGKSVNQDNLEEMLTLAESTPTKLLEKQLKGEKPLNNAHCVLMYFTPKQYKELEEALLSHGATQSGSKRGIQNKENALIAALRELKAKAA